MNLKTKTIIAHRGASALVKFENTMEAFNKAIELGAPVMEFDVRITKDNIMISYHDDSISNGKKIRDLTYEEIQVHANSKGFSIPKVEEILKISRDKIMLDIELKEAGYEKEVIKLVKKYLRYDEFVMKSFLDEVIITIKKIDANIRTGLLLGIGNTNTISLTRISELFPLFRILKTRPDFISPNYNLLKFGFISRMKLLNLPIWVWTVNDEKLMKDLFSKGISGIITDRPDVGLKLIK